MKNRNGWISTLPLSLTTLVLALVIGRHGSANDIERPQDRRDPDAIEVHRNIEYARVGGTGLLLDIYQPQDVKRPPVVIWIHGGGWQNGSKGNGGRLLSLTRHGYAVVSINYRLSREAVFPAQIHDCKGVIRWLRANAATYGFDADRIGVAGSSAGGHLAALLGTSGGSADLEGNVGGNLDQSSRVQAVCDMWGPTDLSRLGGRQDKPNSPEANLIGGPIRENKDKVALANPVLYVDKDDPPVLLIHGQQDYFVPVSQSELLHEALQQVGVATELHVLKDTGHGGSGASRQIRESARAFFDRHLKPE